MGVVVLRRYIDILTIIINFPYSTCISSFFGSSIPTSLFIFKMFFRSYIYRAGSLIFLLLLFIYNYNLKVGIICAWCFNLANLLSDGSFANISYCK